jgi:hypothetical protein
VSQERCRARLHLLYLGEKRSTFRGDIGGHGRGERKSSLPVASETKRGNGDASHGSYDIFYARRQAVNLSFLLCSLARFMSHRRGSCWCVCSSPRVDSFVSTFFRFLSCNLNNHIISMRSLVRRCGKWKRWKPKATFSFNCNFPSIFAFKVDFPLTRGVHDRTTFSTLTRLRLASVNLAFPLCKCHVKSVDFRSFEAKNVLMHYFPRPRAARCTYFMPLSRLGNPNNGRSVLIHVD